MTTIADPTDDHAEAIARLLAALEAAPTAPAGIAYRAAIKRHGREIAQAEGVAAMRAVLETVATTSERRSAVLAAWEGIAGWSLEAAA